MESHPRHVKVYKHSIKNCVRPSLTSKLLARLRHLLALSARAASAAIPPTLDSRTYFPTSDMAPAVANGPIEPSGTSSRGSQSTKMHSKVVGFSLPIPSLSLLSWHRFGSLEGARPDLRQIIDASFRVCAQFQPLTSLPIVRSSLALAPRDIPQQFISPARILILSCLKASWPMASQLEDN